MVPRTYYTPPFPLPSFTALFFLVLGETEKITLRFLGVSSASVKMKSKSFAPTKLKRKTGKIGEKIMSKKYLKNHIKKAEKSTLKRNTYCYSLEEDFRSRRKPSETNLES